MGRFRAALFLVRRWYHRVLPGGSEGDRLPPMTIDLTGGVHFGLLLFARYAEVVGVDACDLVLSASATVADALAELRLRYPTAGVLPIRPLCARNHSQVAMEDEVRDGDELALLPPLAGG